MTQLMDNFINTPGFSQFDTAEAAPKEWGVSIGYCVLARASLMRPSLWRSVK